MEEKPKKKKLKSSVVSGTPKIEIHIPYDVLPDDVPVISDLPSEMIRLMRDDVPTKTNEMVAIEKLIKENIAFCVGKDFITVEGRNHTFRYFCITDAWVMTGSLKTGNGIDSLIDLLLRR